ncbi:MAG TPA: hypothetical protein DDZ53_09480, partial [Firmicutes bacterium]|nr:hypothetical protein [Bacillota bacterium]
SSGTTGLAAVEQNRRFIGIDTSHEYLQLAKKRIESVRLQSDRVMEAAELYIAN